MDVGATNRVSGLMSGFDTEKYIKEMMDAERVPLDRMKQQKTVMEWQRDTYRELNRDLYALRNEAFDMGLQREYTGKAVTSSNPFIVTATAKGGAPNTANQIVVNQLATNATLTSTGAIAHLQEEDSQFKTVPFTLRLERLEYEAGEDPFVAIQITEQMTAKEFVNAINKQSKETGVEANFDPNLQRFFFTQTKTGAEAKIHFSAEAGEQAALENFIREDLHLVDPDSAALLTSAQGQNASIQINGITFDDLGSNQFTINNISYQLHAASPKDGAGHAQPTFVNVTQDIDGTVDKIKAFIESYNNVVSKLTDTLNEKREKGYQPLTDAQREQLSEKQQEQWETKAKSGLLKGDATLSNVLYQMRNAMYDTVQAVDNPKYKHLSALGIKVNMYDHNDPKLYIDEDKLRTAIQDDPDAVMQLFTNRSDNPKEQGLAVRLKDTLDQGFKQIKEKVGSDDVLVDQSFFGERLKKMDERIVAFQERLQQKEEFYWQKFTAMEKALSKYNAQAGWLMSQFGGGQ